MTEAQLIETAIALGAYVIARVLIHRSIDRTVANNKTSSTRGKVVKKAIDVGTLSILAAVIFSIYGVDQSELALFIGSVMTVVGVAFFAQWSILSNITSGIIIFFNHPVKLDDTLTVVDKDYEVRGRISNIGLFFVTLKTTENEVITIPNSVFLQKMIKKQRDEQI
jgi:small-conductance mechanosensitive channel